MLMVVLFVGRAAKRKGPKLMSFALAVDRVHGSAGGPRPVAVDPGRQ
jgi:hypothetical protein